MSNDLLAGLVEFIRREATAAAIEAVRAELLRCRPGKADAPRLLSLAAIGRRYGVGRKEATSTSSD